MIAIYTPYLSNRTKYVLEYIFKQQFGCDYDVFENVDQATEKHIIKINYSSVPCDGWIQILPHGILERKGLSFYNIQFTLINEMTVIFGNACDIGFDIFGAIFYCLVRYEEYCCLEYDKHDRYSYKNSIFYHHQYLQTPLVDLWVAFFESYLKEISFNELRFKEKEENRLVPTIDVDSVFSYKGKKLVRQLGGLSKDILGGKWPQINRRMGVLINKAQDPFDNFDYQFETLKRVGLKANYFIQVGDNGPYDKNISPHNKAFQKLIKRIVSEGHEVGLHPSYQSFCEDEIIQKEKQILENIIERPIFQSRQHYLRFALPSTYISLIKLGIKREFSMGYSEVPGYRANTANPFYWYDIEMETITELEIVPFSMMDVAFKEFMHLTMEDTLQYSAKMIGQLEKVKGDFNFIFHNESLSDYGGWKGWRTVFESWLSNGNKTY